MRANTNPFKKRGRIVLLAGPLKPGAERVLRWAGPALFLLLLLLFFLLQASLGWAKPAVDLFAQGQQLYQSGQYPQAIAALEKATRPGQSNASRARYYLALAYVQIQNYGQAKAQYQALLKQTPNTEANRALLQKTRQNLAQLQAYLAQQAQPQDFSGLWLVGEAPANFPASGVGSANKADVLSGLTVTGRTYTQQVMQGGRSVRWSVLNGPLKLYVPKTPPPGFSGFNLQYAATVESAIKPWLAALNNQLLVEPTPNPEQADLQVIWTAGLGAAITQKEDKTTLYTGGLTQPVIQNGQLRQMQIQLALKNAQGQPVELSVLYKVALHEFGHALGLLGHSPVPADVMYGQTPTDEQSHQGQTLSAADVATIRQVYGQPAGITSLPPPATGAAGFDTAQRLAALQNDLKSAENEVALRPTSPNWVNVATVALNVAQLMEPAFDGAETQAVLTKALAATSQALKQEPNNEPARYLRCLAYERLNQPELALQEVKTLIKQAPNQPKYQLQAAWLMVQTGRKAEAKNYLDVYHQQVSPTQAAQDPLHQKVMTRLQAP